MTDKPEKKATLSKIKYMFVFFPVACLRVCGDIAVLSVFGINVYYRVGICRRLFGINWGCND